MKKCCALVLCIGILISMVAGLSLPAAAETENNSEHRHCVCLGLAEDHTCRDPLWEPWPADGKLTADHCYYLTEDLELTAPVRTGAGHIAICLNGHKITGAERFVYFSSTADTGMLEVCDCKGTGMLFTDGNADYGGAVVRIYNDSGIFCAYGVHFKENSPAKTVTSVPGGLIYAERGMCMLYGCDLEGNTADYGGCLRIGEGAEALAVNCVFHGGNSGKAGGNLYCSGKAELRGCTVTGGTTSGTGPNIACRGNMTLTDTVIFGGEGANAGGNVSVEKGGTLTMNGGRISGGTTTEKDGGNVHVIYGGTFVLNSGTVENGTAVNGSGGNISVYGRFVMNGGTVKCGTAKSIGGNVSLYMNTENQVAEMELNGGSIYGGEATNAGNVRVGLRARLTVNGGEIGDCYAKVGSTYVYTNADGIVINGGKIINNLYGGGLYLESGAKVTVGAEATEGSVGINGKAGTLISSLSATAAKVFFADNPRGTLKYSSSALSYSTSSTHKDHCVCAQSGMGSHSCETLTWQTLSASVLASGGSLPSGNYYLTEDVTMTAKATVAQGETVNLCLNGHTVTAPAAVRFAECSGTLRICDCTINPGKITGGKANGSVVNVMPGGCFELYNGTLAGTAEPASATATSQGGVLLVGTRDASELQTVARIYGGTLDASATKCASGSAATVCKTAKLYLNGGRIIGGRANVTSAGKYGYGGGVQVAANGYFEMNGGLMEGGSAETYGGNLVVSGTAVLAGGVIRGGTADKSGGNIVIFNGATDTVLSGTTVVDGTAQSAGGNILVNGRLTITGSTLADGNAKNGGNLAVTGADSDLTVSGCTLLCGMATGYGGNFYCTGKAALTNTELRYGMAPAGVNMRMYGGTVTCTDITADGIADAENTELKLVGTVTLPKLRLALGQTVDAAALNNASGLCVEACGGVISQTVSQGLKGGREEAGKTLWGDAVSYTLPDTFGVGISQVGNASVLMLGDGVSQEPLVLATLEMQSLPGKTAALWEDALSYVLGTKQILVAVTGSGYTAEEAEEMDASLALSRDLLTAARKAAADLTQAHAEVSSDGATVRFVREGTDAVLTCEGNCLRVGTATEADASLTYTRLSTGVAQDMTQGEARMLRCGMLGILSVPDVLTELNVTGSRTAGDEDATVAQALATLLGTSAPKATAGGKSFATVQGAIDSGEGVVKLTADTTEQITVNSDVYLDLNGHDLSGTVTLNGGAFYGTDSTTYGFTDTHCGHLKAAFAGGTPQLLYRAEAGILSHVPIRILGVQNATGYTFHRFYFETVNTLLQPSVALVGFQTKFCGDNTVISQLSQTDTVTYLVKAEGSVTRRYRFDAAFTAGENTVNLWISSLFDENHPETDSQRATTELFAEAYLSIGSVKVAATEQTLSLKSMVEQADLQLEELPQGYQYALYTMCKTYADTLMKGWSIENILGYALPVNHTEKNAYFALEGTPDTDTIRQGVVDAMQRFLSLQWTTNTLYEYYKTGAVSEKLFRHEPGAVFAGLPYTNAGTGLVVWYKYYDPDTGLLNFAGDGTALNSKLGATCASTICNSMGIYCPSIKGTWATYTMVPAYGFLPVGDYDFPTTITDLREHSTLLICEANGAQTMYEAYACVEKADAFTSTPDVHAVMADDDAVVFRNADGTVNPDRSYVVICDQRAGVGKKFYEYTEDGVTLNYSGRTYHRMTFAELYALSYVPVTTAEMQGTAAYQRATASLTGTPTTYASVFNYKVVSNYTIALASTVLVCSDGTEQELGFATYAKGNNGADAPGVGVSLGRLKTAVPASAVTAACQAGKHYTAEIRVTAVNGETITVASVKVQ